jgi:hypothetical protein
VFQFEALRRVHLIPSSDTPEEETGVINSNVFRDLDSSVSEGGENFSTGSVYPKVFVRKQSSLTCFSREKQLLCMARAILKRSKVLVMDEVRWLQIGEWSSI